VLASSAIVVLITAVMFLVVEGVSSVIIVSRGAGEEIPLERSHTEFDRDLGWVNAPSVFLRGLYGKGRHLQTNSQRFRNARDFTKTVPPGKLRAVCTGDSFTLGYGVNNDDAWCNLLMKKDSRLETVNMGQGGYGVDQAYLWYRRDGPALEHDVLIFAFIAEDFGRMMCETFLGYPKPVLTVEAGRPRIKRRSSHFGFLAAGVGQRLRNLRFSELWRSRARAETDPQVDFRVMSDADARALALSIFEDLAAIQAQRKQSWLVVLLPILDDYAVGETDVWRDFLSVELAKRGIPFLDLVPAMRELPKNIVSTLYRGHYNENGNRWVADRIYAAVVNLQRARERLEQIGPPARPIEPLLAADFHMEPIDLKGAHLRANAMNTNTSLALDGLSSTRWHSGAPQTGHEELLLDLGKPTPLRQLILELGEFGYDYGRNLAVDVGEDEAHLFEVLKISGEDARVNNTDVPGQVIQILTLPKSVEARFVRIRQLGRSEDNYWSVAEIGLYREK
jgi:hypothetical protein